MDRKETALAMSRTFYRSIALAKGFTTDIDVSELELIKHSDQQKCYNFSAKLLTSAGDETGTASRDYLHYF